MRKTISTLLPLLFVCAVVGLGLAILNLNTGSWWPPGASLLSADAGWYHTIVQHDYLFDPNGANNTAFFPLFPYLWKFLQLSPVGISVLNALLFISGAYVLFQNFPAGIRLRSIYLALSLLVFYTTPMSEGLFFFCSSLLLTGLQKEKHSCTIMGLIGCALCRSVSTLFIPAFLAMALLSRIRQQQHRVAVRYLLYAGLSFLILLAVFFIHWYQTGHFFAFYQTQRFWYAWFRLPNMPFTTWPPWDNRYVDQFAALLAFLSIIYLVYYFVLALRQRAAGKSPATLLAFLYMGGTILLMLFTHGGGFNSINRYILSTPFLYLFLREVAAFRFTTVATICIMVFGIVYYLVGWHMGVGMANTLIFLSVLTAMYILVLVIKSASRWASLTTILFVLAALYVQAILWSRFVTGIWVG